MCYYYRMAYEVVVRIALWMVGKKRWVDRKRWLVIKWYIKSIIQDFGQPVSYLIPAIFFSGCIVFAVSWLCGKKSTIKHRIPFAFFLAYILVIFRVAFLCRKPGSRKAISLVLFETWGHTPFICTLCLFRLVYCYRYCLENLEVDGHVCWLDLFALVALRYCSILLKQDI